MVFIGLPLNEKKERSTFILFLLCFFPNPFVYEVRDPVQYQMHVLEVIGIHTVTER